MSKNFNSTTPQGPKHTKTQTWLTPPWIIEKLGGKTQFSLDPCQYQSPEKGIIVETAMNYYFEDDDGLSKNWYGNIWLNPPYNTRDKWLEKIAAHYRGICLIFVRSETRSFQEYVKTATGINLIKKRIEFLNENGEIKSNGNAASCLIAWGEDNYERIKNIEGIYCKIDKNNA